jgi:hypothetical protein
MTSERAPSPALRWSGVLLIGLACAAAAVTATRLLGAADLPTIWRQQPLAFGALVAAPLVAAMLAALLAGAGRRAGAAARSAGHASTAARPPASGAAARAQPAAKPEDAALQLLALLQHEGRFVDFLEEDLAAYPDEQIGAAVRAIHEGCRTALRDRLGLAPVLAGSEGATVTVERGFDPAAVRVTGNVRGEPPYQGVLRHPGWRSTGFTLPARTGDHDASILAPAEVEVL